MLRLAKTLHVLPHALASVATIYAALSPLGKFVENSLSSANLVNADLDARIRRIFPIDCEPGVTSCECIPSVLCC